MKRLVAGLLLCLAFAIQATAQNARAGAVRLEGQVVCCADCWAEADRTRVEYGTAEDLLKARACVEGGDPTLLAVREGDRFTLYQLEQGRFRLPGPNWLEYVGRRVAVSGATRQARGTRILRVDALEVLAPSLAERQAANVVGQEVELTLRDLTGAEQRLSALRGRIVVLNFWATYCAPCRTEMPDLAAIQNEYAALGVQVIGASTDAAEERATVMRFVREVRVNFPIWTGATVPDMMRFGLGGALPGTVIIGKDGRIVRVISGVVNQADLKRQIDQMLAAAEATAQAAAEAQQREQVASTGGRPGEASSVPS